MNQPSNKGAWTGALVKLTVLAGMVLTSGTSHAAAPATNDSPHLSGTNGYRSFYQYSPALRPGAEFAQQGPLDWPAAEMREVAFARARTVIARYDVMRARQMLSEHIDRQRRQFERSDEFVAARLAEDEAWAAYQSVRDSALARLANDETYQALTQLTGEITTQIRDVKLELGAIPRGAHVPAVLLDLAGSKLDYARRATAMRSAALADDPAVAEALASVRVASARVRQMRGDFNDRIRDHETVLALRDELFDARTASVAAAAYEDSARYIRRLAWRFARYLHRNDASPYYGTSVLDPYYGVYGTRYDVRWQGAVVPIGGYEFKRR